LTTSSSGAGFVRPTFSLLAISDRASLLAHGIDLADWLRSLQGAGGDLAVQLREKDLDDGPLLALARLARTLLPPPAPLLVNGRLDIALAAGAEGVHLPADGVPAAPLRARFAGGAGGKLLIGRSTHSVEEVERARDDGADYVTFGPVYSTPGKGAPVGLDALARAAAAGLPVYALGGVTLERFDELAAAGAAGFAAIRLFQSAAWAEIARAARVALGRA
jgi:thiamine-phosphate pyrophosphorylase